MKRFVPMALCVLVMALGMSPAVLAVAQPFPQNATGATEGAPPPRSRPPLFQVRYVLVKATPQPQEEPQLDFGDGEPAIRLQTFSGWPGAQLKGGAYKPNTIVCYGWSCMDSQHR